MASRGSDKQLAELCAHFGIPIEGLDPDILPLPDPPYWANGKLRVFISHLTAHREEAADIQTFLSRYGMSAFVAHNDINPTTEWQIEIERALSTCDLLVGLLHPSFIESQWCDQEIGYALGRGVPVYMVRCGADPYGFVSRFQAFDGNGKRPMEIARMIFDAATEHKKLQERMAAVLVDLFVSSNSYADARTRVGYLNRIVDWKPDFTTRIQRAVESNDQVSGSWDVPEMVKRLLAKHELRGAGPPSNPPL